MPAEVNLGAIEGFRLVAADPAQLAAFYRAVGFTIGQARRIPVAEMRRLGLSGTGERIPMSLGPSQIDLEGFDPPGRSYPWRATACDLIFQHLALVTDDARTAWARAREAGAVLISAEGPVRLPASAGGVTAVKFRDPEGHPLEFLQFPAVADSGWTG
ncbi:MAG: VOC family protein, partial [Caulobacteraceae bacterium]